MEFECAGTKIEVLSDGDFVANIGGKIVHKPSLAAIKKAIKEYAALKFEPFDAIAFSRYGNTPLRVRVTGIGKNAYKSDAFFTSGGQETSVVSVACDALVKRIQDLRKKLKDSEIRGEKKIGAMEKKLVWIEANSYQPKKMGDGK